MKILKILEKSRDFYFLITASFFFFLLRLPSFFEPYWYGDEGIYQVIGLAVRNGRLLYRDIWDNKPPLLYVLYAIFSSDQFVLRFVSFIFGALSVIVFFFLSKELFTNGNISKTPKTVYFSTLIFAGFFGLPIIEGNIANSENFMALPILIAALLIWRKAKKLFTNGVNRKEPLFNFQLFTIGLIISIAFLFKIVAVFDFTAFLLFLLFTIYKIHTISKEKKIIYSLLSAFTLSAGFIIPIIFTAIFFLINGAFSDFFRASFVQNVGYVGYGNKLLIGQGLLLIKLILLSLFVLFIFIKRNVFSQTSIFILIWFAFSIFNALFSGRPYTHYLLVLLPAFCLFLQLILLNKTYQKIFLIITFIAIILFSKNFTIYKKTLPYYQNFLLFILNYKSVSSYQSFFDNRTPVDYQMAQFIKEHSNNKDNIFIWGNNAQLYFLVNKLPPGRYIVAYHITGSKTSLTETLDALNEAKPKFIIITNPKDYIPYSMIGYNQKIKIGNSLIYEKSY